MTVIRSVAPEDATAIASIYDPLVVSTAISFEIEAPGPAAMALRIAESDPAHPWLVAIEDETLVGYAYASRYRDRPAYRFSVETTIYIAEPWRGRGVGRGIYQELLDRLAAGGLVSAYAGIALPNPASEAVHSAVGFTPIGVFPNAGLKFERWHDVAWWYRDLRPA
jgi:L-amino acid N-acyltransferase YncA